MPFHFFSSASVMLPESSMSRSSKRSWSSKAVEDIDYVECAADGVDSQRAKCDRRGVKGYPTWDIGGELYPGEKSLDELAELSGFTFKQ